MNPFSNLSLDQLDDLDPEAMSGPALVLLLEHLNHLYVFYIVLYFSRLFSIFDSPQSDR